MSESGRFNAETRRALFHIAYGPPLRLSWRDQFTFAYRDLKREWHGHSPSSYTGRYIRMVRCPHSAPRSFKAGRVMRLYLAVFLIAPDLAFRLRGILRKRSIHDAGVAKTRAMARRGFEAHGR